MSIEYKTLADLEENVFHKVKYGQSIYTRKLNGKRIVGLSGITKGDISKVEDYYLLDENNNKIPKEAKMDYELEDVCVEINRENFEVTRKQIELLMSMGFKRIDNYPVEDLKKYDYKHYCLYRNKIYGIHDENKFKLEFHEFLKLASKVKTKKEISLDKIGDFDTKLIEGKGLVVGCTTVPFDVVKCINDLCDSNGFYN